MDEREKRIVADMLRRASPNSTITKQLKIFLEGVTATKVAEPNLAQRSYVRFSDWYERVWHRRSSNTIVRVFFIIEILLFVLAVVLAVASNIDNVQEFFKGHADYGHSLVIGQAIGTSIAAWFAVRGMLALRISRLEAFEWFRRATQANLLLTEFFIFSRIQFGAMPGFIFNLALLLLINFVIGHERRAR